MPNFVVVHGSVRHPGGTARVGDSVELGEEDAKRFEADGVVVSAAKFSALKKQAEGAVEAGSDLAKQEKPIRNIAAMPKAGVPVKHEVKEAPKPSK